MLVEGIFIREFSRCSGVVSKFKEVIVSRQIGLAASSDPNLLGEQSAMGDLIIPERTAIEGVRTIKESLLPNMDLEEREIHDEGNKHISRQEDSENLQEYLAACLVQDEIESTDDQYDHNADHDLRLAKNLTVDDIVLILRVLGTGLILLHLLDLPDHVFDTGVLRIVQKKPNDALLPGLKIAICLVRSIIICTLADPCLDQISVGISGTVKRIGLIKDLMLTNQNLKENQAVCRNGQQKEQDTREDAREKASAILYAVQPHRQGCEHRKHHRTYNDRPLPGSHFVLPFHINHMYYLIFGLQEPYWMP